MLQRWRHARRCRRQAGACANPVLSRYLAECAAIHARTIADTPLIAADLELTGLDKSRDHIVALGWTLIDQGRIHMGSSRHLLVASGKSVGSSAVIHELMDSDLVEGADLDSALEALFTAAAGRIWVFHHAGLDVSFLRKACLRWAGVAPGFMVLDTLRIEYRLRRRREVPVRQGDLQLPRIRGVYGLPGYTAHNALTDAMATAELMLAIAAGLDRDGPLALAPHLKFF